jgi:hypothetical protein
MEGAMMRETGQGTDIAPAVHHQETDVLTPAECMRALKIGASQWYVVAPSLPVSYALGKKSPRYVWGEVLKYLKRTGAAA